MSDEKMEIKFDTQKLERALSVMPGKIFTGLKRAFGDVGDTFHATMVNERLSGHSATSLGVRTGHLRGSFKKAVTGGNLDDLTMFFYTTSKYAEIHEKGGTIYPKNTKYLAIPLSAARQPSGASQGYKPRSLPLVYGGRSKAGNIILRLSPYGAALAGNRNKYTTGEKTAKGRLKRFKLTAGVPMFVLVKSVTIPARLNMMVTWNRDIPVTMGILNNAVDKVIKNN